MTLLGVDFLVFSGHKMCGPTGIGVLWGRRVLLQALPPFLTGGEMNEEVSLTSATFADPPSRFEAGTPMIAQVVGLAAACTYLDQLGRERVAAHGESLTARALAALASIEGVRIVGPADPVDRGPAVSFAVTGRTPEEVGAYLDSCGIAIRVGHLCARPACLRFGLPATTRASFYLYNTEAEVDALCRAVAELADTRPTRPGAGRAPHTRPATADDPLEFLDRVLDDAATAATAVTVVLGDRLGLYRAMDGAGAMTAAQLATRTGTWEVYVTEWLHTQVGAGYVRCGPPGLAGELTYALPEAHAAVLARPNAATAGIGIFGVMQSLHQVEEELVNGFRTGSGIDWSEYPAPMFRSVARFFRPAYDANLVSRWLPALDGVVDRLAAGGRVADIGCGVGHSALLMAQAFPRSTVHGFDYHEESIRHARILAEEHGLTDRVEFHSVAAADLTAPNGAGYDLVTFLNCLHDMGDPVAAVRGARRVIAPDGTAMLVEPNAHADPMENQHPAGRLFMAFSTTICLPAAVAQAGPMALGNHPGEDALRAIAQQGGFTRWRRSAETPRSAVYELRP